MINNIRAGQLDLAIEERGEVWLRTGGNGDSGGLPLADRPSPLLRVLKDGELLSPSRCESGGRTGELTLTYPNGTAAKIGVQTKDGYAVLEVLSIEQGEPDAILWGPFRTSVGGSIGESVGIVHDGRFAIGLQALNAKTVGGWPLELERLDGMASSYAEGAPDPDGRQPSDSKFEYPVCTAWPTTDGGSVLQAYTRDRTKRSIRQVWNVPSADVRPFEGEDAVIAGSRIALFGCPFDQVLSTIERIELGEDLPHPTIEGQWGKTSPAANQSYLITDFTEETIGDAVRYAKLAGLRYVYHPDPFEQWGHFKLKRGSFPSGDEGLKLCSETARAEGISLGIHTLSNFTTLNDPYVSPVPDKRLQPIGSAELLEEAGERNDWLVIDEPWPFTVSLYRKTARIGNELVEYETVSETAPWRLLGVKRGMHGTAASKHAKGEKVDRLWDHPYDVVFPDLELQDEYADRLAELMNRAGIRQVSFDGLEGLYATGQDDYGVVKFVERQYRRWKQEVINDASIAVPNYLWHIATRFNWGEPWGAETREGQLEWRLSNQRYFERNFIPRMLGWFLIRSASDRFESTALDEIEWVLSKAAGFGAGFALVADGVVLKRNGNIEPLLAAVREWETARRLGAFSAEQRKRLVDPKGDWHLEPDGVRRWKLYPVQATKPLVCSPAEQQPGQPGGSDWALFNKYNEQPLRFTMRVRPSYGNEDAAVQRPTFYTDGVYMTFDTEVAANQYLECDGTRIGRVYDANRNLIRVIEASAEAPTVRHGGQTLSFSAKFVGDPKPDVAVKVWLRGSPETVAVDE
ncbi:hypothetical protein [Cohnella sp.]|uniref:hypothetical protein n=1 Tax=Cohnella sp. TaxID=1883426 RepID=UPI003569CB43